MPLIRKSAEQNSPPAPALSASALQAGTADERWAAARRLATPADVGALAGALAAESDPRVREAILGSLARIQSREAVEAVVIHIRSDDAALRTGALDALRAMPDAARERLPHLLRDGDSDVRLLACEVARACPDGEVTRLLCDLLDRDGEVNVCAAAIDVLAELGGPDAIPAMARCIERFPDQPFLQFCAKLAIERIGPRPGDGLG